MQGRGDLLQTGKRIFSFARITLAIAGLAVLALVCVLVLPLLVPSADLRHAATAAISAATGREPVISGEPALKLLPSPRLVLGKVTFPLPAGQALDAENVVTRLRIWPLFSGRAEVADVTLERPTLILIRPEAGPDDPSASVLARLGETTLAKTAAAMLPLMARADLPELRITSGTIAVRAPSGLTEELIGGIMASLDHSGDRKGIALSLELEWRDVPVSGTLVMDDAQAFLSGTQVPTHLTLSAAGSALRFRGIAALGSAPSAEGQLNVESPSLRRLLGWIGVPAPARSGFGPFSLAARANLEAGTLSLANARVELDGNPGEGALLAKLSGPRPQVQGTLAADTFSLEPYGRISLLNAHGTGWDRTPIDLSPLDTFDLDLRLSAAEVKSEASVFTTVAASAVLSGGRMVLAVGQANGWGGLIRATMGLAVPGRLRTGTLPAGGTVQVEAELTDINLETALADIAGIRQLGGRGDLQLDLRGEGRNVYDMAQNLSGSIVLAGDGGALVGFDVPQALQRIERRPLGGGVDARGGRTAFNTLNARIAIRNGTATVQQLEIEGRQARVALSGTAVLALRELDLSGRAALLAPQRREAAPTPARDPDTTGKIAEDKRPVRLEMPFTVRGSWEQPVILADPQSLLERSGAAQSLMEAVRQRSDAALDPAAPAEPAAARSN